MLALIKVPFEMVKNSHVNLVGFGTISKQLFQIQISILSIQPSLFKKYSTIRADEKEAWNDLFMNIIVLVINC